MNITIYQLFGINKVDTPVFDSVENQNYFFDHQGLSEHTDIDTGFYPPYFRNRIKVEITNFNWSTSHWNYLRLEYNNKYYYYFITSIEYVNEDIVVLNVEMDTIQTYMFTPPYSFYELERETIVRWDRTTRKINRKYIRENISKGTFTKIYFYSEANTDDESVKNWLYIAKLTNYNDGSTTKDVSTLIQTMNPYTGLVIQSKENISPYSYAILPHYTANDNLDNTIVYYPIQTIEKLRANAFTAGIHLIPFKCLETISVNEQGKLVRPAATTNYKPEILWGTNSYSLYNENTMIKHINRGLYTFTYFNSPSSITLGQSFTPKNIPALLDCNYIKFTFGDPNIRSEYPLYVLEDLEIYLSYWADIEEGYRYYNIYTGEDCFDNRYNTIVVNTNTLSLDLKNDLWGEYIARNRATMAGAIGSMFISLLSGGLISGTTYANDAPGMGPGTNAIKTGASAGSNILNESIKQINLQNAPSTLKAAGNSAGIISEGDEIISIKLSLCDDFDECAKFFEAYGYRVAHNLTLNPFVFLKNRHLYDYIKASEVGLSTGLPTEIANDFASRMIDGLRMWHTTNGVLNCKQSPYLMGMGQLYVYDNIEEWLYQDLT